MLLFKYRRRGAIAPFVALCLPVLLTLIAFAIQLSYRDLSRSELRTAVDAAAEAGARKLSDTGSTTEALAAAKAAALRNTVGGQGVVLADADVVFGHVSRINELSRFDFTPSNLNPTALRVSTQQQRPHVFGILADNLDVGTAAVAGQIDRDVALVLDRSGSMVYVQDDGTPTNWTAGEPAPSNSRWVKAASGAAGFLSTLANDTPMAEKVSLVTYNGSAAIEDELTFTYSSLNSSIDAYTQSYEDGSTNIADGIEKGRQSLIDNGFGRSWAAKTIVLMTDGIHNTGVITPQEAATVAAGQGIVIHTITYGDDADQAVMQEVATIGGGQHWHAPNSGQLQQVFQEIADNLPTMLME